MALPEDARFAFIVCHEAWWWRQYIDAEHRRSIMVQAAADGGGVVWEFRVEQYDNLGGGPALRLQMFDDSWDAFAHIPELFKALREERPTTLDALRTLLVRLGAVDITERRMA